MTQQPRSSDDLARYEKQTRFEPLGEAGQRRLLAGRVLIVGCGALGSVLSESLVRAGVGFVRIVDRDVLELSNLQRQTLFNERDVADQLPKAVAAAARLRSINSSVTIEPHVGDLTHTNLRTLADGVDLILDGTDNFATRLLMNDYAFASGTPWVYAGVVGAEGRVMPIVPGKTACLACLLPEAPRPGETATCDSAGVLGPAVSVVASLQAIEAIKLLASGGEEFTPGLTVVDLWDGRWRRMEVPPAADCRVCQRHEYDWLEGRLGDETTLLCGRNAVQISPAAGAEPLDLGQTRRRLGDLGPVTGNQFLLRFEYEGKPLTLFKDGRVLVGDVEDAAQARSLVARCLGR